MAGAVSLRAASSRDEGGSLAWLLQRQETEKQEGPMVGYEGWDSCLPSTHCARP